MLKLIWVNTNSVQCLYILKYLKIIVLPLPTFDLVCVSNLLRSNQLIPRNPPPCLPTCCLPPGFFSGRLLPLSLFMYFHWELLLHLHTCLCVLFCHLAFEKTLLRPLTIFCIDTTGPNEKLVLFISHQIWHFRRKYFKRSFLFLSSLDRLGIYKSVIFTIFVFLPFL